MQPVRTGGSLGPFHFLLLSRLAVFCRIGFALAFEKSHCEDDKKVSRIDLDVDKGYACNAEGLML